MIKVSEFSFTVVLVICRNLARDTLIKVDERTFLCQPKRTCNPEQQRKAPDLLTLGDCGRTSVAVFVCLDTVKTTRESESLRRSPRLASSTSTRLKLEEQVSFASQTCSPGIKKGDTSVDPTERLNSKFMVPSQQPALTLVASPAAEDPGSQLPSFAITSENQVARIKSTSSTDKSIASSSSTAFKYIYNTSAPAQDSAHFSDEPLELLEKS